jgi:peptide/nickel transport system substrate-binding protein
MPTLQLFSAQSAGYGIVYLNLQRESAPFFQEKEVRQALLYSLDRQLLISEVLGGQGLIADSPILPIIWAYDPSVRTYRYDPERAIGLLDASGWLDSNGDRIRDRDGVDLAFTLLSSVDPVMARMAEELSRQWHTVGIEVTIRPVADDAAADSIRNRDFDAALTEIGLTADPDPYPLWHSTQAESGQNFSGFANQDADLMMEASRFTTDPEQRAELYHSFQQLFAEEVPSLLLYYPIYSYAVDDQVQGVQLSPLLHSSDRFRNITAWYVETEEVVVTEIDGLDKIGN